MILFDLRCGAGHVFEAWFKNGDAYEAQAAAREINCPICGDGTIAKAPMAPRIGKSRGDPAQESLHKQVAPVRRKLEELRRRIEASCDYVGDRFAEEARRIHYGETPHRDIYGGSDRLRGHGVAGGRGRLRSHSLAESHRVVAQGADPCLSCVRPERPCRL